MAKGSGGTRSNRGNTRQQAQETIRDSQIFQKMDFGKATQLAMRDVNVQETLGDKYTNEHIKKLKEIAVKDINYDYDLSFGKDSNGNLTMGKTSKEELAEIFDEEYKGHEKFSQKEKSDIAFKSFKIVHKAYTYSLQALSADQSTGRKNK